jgi:hypothetical protein
MTGWRVEAVLLACLTLTGSISCAGPAGSLAVPPAPDSTVDCSRWRVEVFNQSEDRVYIYHVWAIEDRLGWVDQGQIAQFIVDSKTRPDIRIKLGHSWYPWAQREDVRITMSCSDVARMP